MFVQLTCAIPAQPITIFHLTIWTETTFSTSTTITGCRRITGLRTHWTTMSINFSSCTWIAYRKICGFNYLVFIYGLMQVYMYIMYLQQSGSVGGGPSSGLLLEQSSAKAVKLSHMHSSLSVSLA